MTKSLWIHLLSRLRDSTCCYGLPNCYIRIKMWLWMVRCVFLKKIDRLGLGMFFFSGLMTCQDCKLSTQKKYTVDILSLRDWSVINSKSCRFNQYDGPEILFLRYAPLPTEYIINVAPHSDVRFFSNYKQIEKKPSVLPVSAGVLSPLIG